MEPATAAAIVTGVLIAMFGYLAEGNAGQYSKDDNRVIAAYSTFVRAFSSVGVLVLVYSTVKVRITQPDDVGLLVLLVFFLAVVGAFTVEAFVRRIEFDEEQIYVRSPWAKHRVISWEQVTRVKWHQMGGAHTLEIANGKPLAVFDFLSGASSLLEYARRWEKHNRKHSGR